MGGNGPFGPSGSHTTIEKIDSGLEELVPVAVLGCCWRTAPIHPGPQV
jgi:hypothetical protein